MSNIAIRVENISKRYRRGSAAPYHRFSELLQQIPASAASTVLGMFGPRWSAKTTENVGPNDFWALQDVSFDVHEGEVLGIIGCNGAGKSTLLKILSRITEPTTGRFGVRGRLASLLEVGTGFHPELTGRENIFLSGGLLGMTRVEIARKFDEIVDFSGVEKSLDTPVKRYSSGMQVRLGFAVAAHLEPEVLIIDEVLAVGDAEFQRKCLGKMSDVRKSGRTILFVSHNLPVIENLCESVCYFRNGRLVSKSPTADALDAYRADIRKTSDEDDRVRQRNDVQRPVMISGANFQDRRRVFTPFEDISIEIKLAVRAGHDILNPRLGVIVTDQTDTKIFTCGSRMSGQCWSSISRDSTLKCVMRELPLTPGEYRIHIVLNSDNGISDVFRNALTLKIEESDALGTGILPDRIKHGPIIIRQEWSLG